MACISVIYIYIYIYVYERGRCGRCSYLFLEFLGFFLLSVKETVIGWRGSFVGKKRKVAWLMGPLCLFWVIWKARNSIAFEDGVLSIQKLKFFFVYLLWSETKLWIKDGPLTLIDFIE